VDRPRRLAIPLLVRFSAMTTTTIGNLGGGYPRPSAYVRLRRQVRELGETDMASMALATLDLVTHDDAQPAFPAVHLEDQTVLSYGEMAGLVGEFERVLRHDDNALVLCDRQLGRAFRIPGGNEGGRIGRGSQPGAAAGP
jgi:hypothetical protein